MLKINKFMIACHDSAKTITLTTPSSLKSFGGMESSANYRTDRAKISTIYNGLDVARRTNKILDKEKITLRRIEMTNSQPKNNIIMTLHSTHNRKIIARQER